MQSSLRTRVQFGDFIISVPAIAVDGSQLGGVGAAALWRGWKFALLSLRVVVLQQTRIARPCVRIVVRIKWTELTGTTGQDLHPAVLDQR